MPSYVRPVLGAVLLNAGNSLTSVLTLQGWSSLFNLLSAAVHLTSVECKQAAERNGISNVSEHHPL